MAKSITFNGITLIRPGGLTKVNARALIPTNLATNGIVAIIGEADAGVGGLTTIDDPIEGRAAFRSGPLADSLRLAFAPTNDPRLGGGAFRVLAYKTNTVSAAQGTVHLPGDEGVVTDTATTGSTTTTVNFSSATLTDATGILYKGHWLKFNNELRRIVSNSTSGALICVVSPGFSSAPISTNPLLILQTQAVLTSIDYGAHTNEMFAEFEAGATTSKYVYTGGYGTFSEQSPEILGNASLEIKYVGGPIATSGSTVAAGYGIIGLGTGVVTATTVVFTPQATPTLNQWAGMVLQFPDGEQRLITGNTAAANSVVTLNASYTLSNAEITRYNLSGLTVYVRNVTQANISIAGASGVATSVTSAVLPTADNLNYTFDANQTLRQFVAYLNNNTNYRATIPAGLNPDTVLMKTFDFGTRNTSVDCRFDRTISYDTKGTFRKDLQDLVDWINANSVLFTAARFTVGTTEGREIPQVTGGSANSIGDAPYWLRDGARGTSSNSTWQTGFDALLDERSQHLVPLISQDLTNEGLSSTATFSAIAAQLNSHIATRNTSARNECGGYMGMKGTRAQLITQAGVFNSGDIQLCGQQVTTLNAAGDTYKFPEWGMAVVIAGSRAGAPEIGTPLTYKYINISAITQDASWKYQSKSDVNALLTAGIVVVEQKQGSGFRIIRDITTYSIDDNLAYTDAHVRDIIRFISFDMRTGLEDQFTGEKANPATVNAVRNFIITKLDVYRNGNLITQSLDPETRTKLLPGYRNITVSIVADIANIRMEIFPCPGINYQLTEIVLQLPILEA